MATKSARGEKRHLFVQIVQFIKCSTSRFMINQRLWKNVKYFAMTMMMHLQRFRPRIQAGRKENSRSVGLTGSSDRQPPVPPWRPRRLRPRLVLRRQHRRLFSAATVTASQLHLLLDRRRCSRQNDPKKKDDK